MEFLERLYERARDSKKRIVLPEGGEVRVLKALATILKRRLCLPVIIGDPEKILRISKAEGIDLNGVEIVNNNKYENLDKYVRLYCEIRRHKNIKEDEARKIITRNPVFYAALGVRTGEFDGFIAGASTTTRDVAKAAILCIGPAEDTPTISSSSVVILPEKDFGSEGVFIFADAGIVPNPTAEQMADIAIGSAKVARVLLNEEPRVAMLSYSTKGSGAGKSVEKVRRAAQLVIKKNPGLVIDGEVQLDCAVVPEVAKRKDPAGRLKGRANILIFPNLDAGNIAYKLTERFAKARAIGPLLQGLSKPASDLSRGCGLQDIIDAVAVIALWAKISEKC